MTSSAGGSVQVGSTVGGETDDGVGTEDASGQGDRGVVLADVHPVGPDGQGQVGAIVEHEGDAGARQTSRDDDGPFEQRPGVEVLVPQLDDVDATGDAGGDEVGQVGSVRGAEVEVA